MASGFGFGVQLLNQILMIPFFLTIWGVKEYGDWILLTTIAGMFTMTDAGLSSVTQNQFVIEYAQKKENTCRSLLTNNLLLISIVAFFSLISCCIFVFCFDIRRELGLHVVDTLTAQCVFLIMTTNIFVKMMGSVIDSIFRANSQMHKSILIGQINTILNLAAIIIGLTILHSMIMIACLSFLADASILIYKYHYTQKIFPYFPKWEYIDKHLFKKLLLPSISFMSYPISNAIIIQGFTLLVNKFIGAEAMVAYNTIRTLTSFVKKIVSMIQVSVWPEYSIAYGKGDINRMRELHRRAFSIAFPLTIISCSFIMIFGEYIYKIWTNGKIEFNFALALAFCLLTIARNIWDTSNVVMVATNKHMRFSIYYLLSSVAALFISVVAIQLYNNVTIFVYSQLIIDIILCYYVIKAAMQLTDDNVISFLTPSFMLKVRDSIFLKRY